MKRKFALFLSIIMLSGCSGNVSNVSNRNVSVKENTEESKKFYAEDAQQLIYAVEAAHPAFIMDDMLPDNYEEAKAKFLETSENSESTDDFEVAVNIYLNSLHDEHTNIAKFATPVDESTIISMWRFHLDIRYIEQDGKLLLTDESYIPIGSEIISVGGIAPETIFGTVDKMCPVENSAAESFYRRNYSLSREILRLSGCDVSGDTVELVCTDGTKQVSFVDVYEKNTNSDEETKTVDIKTINDILYVNINSFHTKDDNYIKALEQVQNFADNGGGKVIVDVRNNLGGQIDFLKDMVRAFDMNIPVGRYISRHDPNEWESVKKDLKAALEDTTFSEYPGTLSATNPNPNVDMVVLCNANSLSVSVMMCAGIQDGKLGKVIGITPCNSPSFFMDPVEYELPNTGIIVNISSSYTFRADETADQEILTPDIPLELKYDLGDNMIKYAVEEYFHEEYVQ